MTDITLVKNHPIEIPDADKDAARRVLFGMVDGLGEKGRKQWRRFIGGLMQLEPGEMVQIKTHRDRSSPYHRRHFAIEQAVFEAQERFEYFDQYIYWIKVGAGWVTWAAGPKGGVVPIPRSISYAKAEQGEFQQFHEQVIGFLRGPHAAQYLWPHLKDAADARMNELLNGFDE
ncbi:MAG TPA: DUF1367 family protein [Acidovorax defluvii]|jgi:hypothetical protein|nr:DUF1367 family protein [Acidovorax defluvii]